MKDRRISLTLCRTFSTMCPDGTCTRKANCPVFNCPGGAGQPEWRGLAAQLIGFWLLFPSHVSSLLVRQGVPFGIVVYGRKPSNDKPRLQVPCRGGRPAGTAAAATTLHRHDGASQRMHVSVPSLLLPSCCSGSPSFLFVVWIIFKPLILFVCRVLKKERHSAMSESSGWCGRQGGASKMSNTCTILYHLWNMYKKRCTFWNNKYLFDFWILASCSLKQNQKEIDFPGIVAGKIFFLSKVRFCIGWVWWRTHLTQHHSGSQSRWSSRLLWVLDQQVPGQPELQSKILPQK